MISPARFSTRALASAAILVLAATAALVASDDPKPDFSSWLSGAEGMKEVSRLYQEEPRPIFVYFYTDWCGFCRQLERELLAHELVEEFMDDILAVRINPELGPGEEAISRRYGVRGFPGLFMLSNETGTWSAVERMKLEGGRPKLLGPEAFVDQLKQASVR